MQENKNIHFYFSRVIELIILMRTYSEQITDQIIVENFLKSMTKKYDDLVSAIEEIKDLFKLFYSELLDFPLA